MQRSNNWHESRAAQLEAEIKHLHDLVDASEMLKSIGKDLIELSDKFRFKQAVLWYRKERAQKEKSA